MRTGTARMSRALCPERDGRRKLFGEAAIQLPFRDGRGLVIGWHGISAAKEHEANRQEGEDEEHVSSTASKGQPHL